MYLTRLPSVRWWLRAAVTVGCALLFPLSPVPAQAVESPDGLHSLQPAYRPPEEELVLQLYLGRYILSEGFIGFTSEGGALLPLSEIAYALEYPIEVYPSEGRAEGWFLRENRRFSLDYAPGEVWVEGERQSVNPEQIELHQDDIYVHSELLSKWFPVTFSVDYSRMVVTVKSQEPLPFEERMEREKKRTSVGSRSSSEGSQYPRQTLPYRIVDWPYADISMNYNVNHDADADGEEQLSQSWRYSSHLSGDLLWMSGTLFFSGSDADEFSDARLSLSRKDPEGELLWGGVTEVSTGDIYAPRIDLIGGGSSGRGMALSSFALNRSSQFSATDLRGELPLGWEVELYRNGTFLDSLASRGDGRYEFLQVPLLYGSNVLELQFYGPQGQRRETTEVINVGAKQLTPGHSQYQLAAIQPERKLFSLGENNSSSDPDAEQLSLQYEYGLNNRFSLAGRAVKLPWQQDERVYTSLGLRSSVWGMASELDVVNGQDTGTAAQLQLQTRLLGLNITGSHAQYNDFESDAVSLNSLSSSDLRLDTRIPETFLPAIPVSLSGTLDRSVSKRKTLTLDNRLSLYFSGASFTNNLNWRESWDGDQSTTNALSGSLMANVPWGDLRLRSSLSYGLKPVEELKSAQLTVDWQLERNYNMQFGVNHNLLSDVTGYNWTLNRQFSQVSLGINTSYYDTGDAFIGTSLSLALGREPRSGDWHIQPKNMANNGGVSARVFLDENTNGSYDAGEPPLPGVRLARSHRDQPGTNEEGILFLPGYSGYRAADIALELSSLEDPYLMPTNPGVNAVLRPGRTMAVDFPVSYVGEVDGTVYLAEGERSKAVSNVVLQLVDLEGEVVAEEKSAFDGFYLFSNVLPGTYLIRPSPEQLKRLKLKQPDAEGVTITGEGEVFSGMDFELRRSAERKSADSK